MMDATLIPLLASPTPIRHTVSVHTRLVADEQRGSLAWHTTLPAPREWDVSFTETTRPGAQATLIYPATAYDWARLNPSDAATLTRVLITTGYEWPGTTNTPKAAQLATLILTAVDLDDETGLATLRLESDECLQEWDRVRPSVSYDVPDDAADLAAIWAAAQNATQPLYRLPLSVDERVHVDDLFLEGVRALTLQPGQSFMDWLWTLAETAGVWLHTDQSPTSPGGLRIEPRKPAHPYGLDLTKDALAPITTRTRFTYTPEAAASDLDLTVTWKEGQEEKTATRRYTNPRAKTKRLAQRSLNLRPPLQGLTRSLPSNWPPALDLLDRLAQRTWTATVEARACYWLRPRDPVVLDHGPALISTISFDGQTGLMTLEARPY